jgi:ParB/RepB/Spo0J family partition protein
METFEIPVSHLVKSKLNSRSVMNKTVIERMSAGMSTSGVINPLTVRSMEPDGAPPVPGVVTFRYEVICGSQRLEAAKQAGLTSVPVRLMKLTDQEALRLIARENIDRDDFHFLDRAEAWRRWKDSGTTDEQIASEMKVSRSTVHNTIALCELTPEVKRACWDVTPSGDPKLPESVAKELCTVPPKLQGLALKVVLAPGPDGKPRTARESIDLIRTQFRLDLKKAPFDPADPALKSEACGGAATCESCPFRTGNAPELFEQAKNDHLCTNPPGFRARQDKQWDRQVEDGDHNRGPKCIPDATAKGLFSSTGELRDDIAYLKASDPCHQDKAQRSYKTLLGKVPEKHLVLARTPSREVVELVPTAKLQEKLDELGVIRRRLNEAGKMAVPAGDEPEQSAEEKKAEREKIERREKATKLAVAEAIGKLEKRGPDKRTWRLLANLLVNSGLERIWERRGVEEAPSKYLDRLSETQLLGFVVEAVMEHDLYPKSPKYTEAFTEFVKLFGVDVKEHERTVTAAERVEPTLKTAVVVEKTAEKSEAKPTAKKVSPKKKGAKR